MHGGASRWGRGEFQHTETRPKARTELFIEVHQHQLSHIAQKRIDGGEKQIKRDRVEEDDTLFYTPIIPDLALAVLKSCSQLHSSRRKTHVPHGKWCVDGVYSWFWGEQQRKSRVVSVSSDSKNKYCAEHMFDSRPAPKRKGQLPVTAGTFAFCAFKAC